MKREELVAVLKAYHVLQQSSFPQLHPTLQERSGHWDSLGEGELREELAQYLRETDASEVRVFWKVGPDLVFAGCNARFLQDSGLQDVSQVLGRNDFDQVFSWWTQAPKFRKDDLEVIEGNREKLNIVERQKSAHGTLWLRTSKAPIRVGAGKPIGLIGMYDVIDAATASRLMFR